ncbi:hypothetical protein SBF1_5220003 [Candidatus Desulfosporosinus infrequens]|uniref:Uncharacterized protein n=1 Tax=Candidatus Desulfosporosinus infrequens TaxID=2043169 RepID=A0A2U3LIE3_9FIRM|nr:hypothetical protein SBF1_5220003 [Candidatus Desulfosporosinus infrequens]
MRNNPGCGKELRNLCRKSILIFLSILAILFSYESNWASFLGEWGTGPDKLEGLWVTIAFLVALILYGIVM